jgi:aryl-alcohol dehydrogenase-like predicted oxidoreductase
LDERGLRILQALDEVAREYKSTHAQVALGWLIARPSITAPIASATNLLQLEDLLAVSNLQLNQAAIERLNVASAPEPELHRATA